MNVIINPDKNRTKKKIYFLLDDVLDGHKMWKKKTPNPGLCKVMLTHRINDEKETNPHKNKNAFWNRNVVCTAECTSLAFETHYTLFIVHE